jgi:hypothetical protein
MKIFSAREDDERMRLCYAFGPGVLGSILSAFVSLGRVNLDSRYREKTLAVLIQLM